MFPFPFSFLGSGEVIPDLELISNDYAMEFDAASSQYVNTSFTIPALTEYSFSTWCKIPSAPSGSSFILADGNSLGQAASVRATIGFYNNFFFAGMGDGVNYWYDRTSYNISAIYDDNWHHVVLTVSLYTQKLYVNGSLVHTYDTSTSSPSSVPAGTIGERNYIIGRYGDYDGGYFDGDIDEVAIWNKTLELADVQTIYNSTNDNPGKCANLFTGGLGSGLIYWNRMGD